MAHLILELVARFLTFESDSLFTADKSGSLVQEWWLTFCRNGGKRMAVSSRKKRQNVTLKNSSWDYLEKLAEEENKYKHSWDKKSTKSSVFEMLIENDRVIRRIEGKEL